MNSLASKLTEAFAKFGERTALVVGDEELTYAELHGAAWAFVDQLERNTPPEARVGLLAQRTAAAYVSVLAAILSGRPYVPINPKFPPEKQKAIAAAADCAAYISDENSTEMAQALAGQSDRCAVSPDVAARVKPGTPRSGRHAYVMFTSGTTGEPKGVAVRYDNVTAYLEAFAQIAPVQPDDRCTQFFDLSFDLSVHDMMVTWTSGACLCVPTDGELIDPVGFAVRSQATCWFSVPSVVAMAKRMRRLAPDSLRALRLSLFCGEALPTSLISSWAEAASASRLFNLYGPTEATIAITAYEVDKAQVAVMPGTVPLGLAYRNCEVAVVDPQGTAVGFGAEGELLLGGAQITDGYVNNPAEQKRKFIDLRVEGHAVGSWYRSGDLVRRDPRWGLVYVGRIDDQVKISGYRVELLEVEEAVRKAAQCPDVAILGWPRDSEGAVTGLIAFVTNSDVNDREIIARCRSLLPTYMIPKRVIAVDRLPLNANGKVDRNALRINYLEPR